MSQLTLSPIGYIQTPYMTIEDCPRNIDLQGHLCKLVVKDTYQAGLMGLRPGQNVLVLYWFDQADRSVLQQHSRRSGELAGIFALRTPNRRNPIGAAVVTIDQIDNNIISIRGLDCRDGTPLLDIRPAMKDEP